MTINYRFLCPVTASDATQETFNLRRRRWIDSVTNPARYRVMIHDDTYYVFDRDKYTFC